MGSDDATEFYWCLHHKRVETADRCGAGMRMGPYESAEAAQQYADTAESRDKAWEADDERWHGPS